MRAAVLTAPVVLVSLVASVALSAPATPALAQDAQGTPVAPAGTPTTDEAEAEAEAAGARPQASEYTLLVQNAIRRAKNRDFDAAMEQLRDAFRLDPSNAIAFYYAGEIDRVQRNLPQALERFRTCAGFAEQTSNDLYRARCMQAMAETLEGTEGQLEQARLAWAAYVQFADSHRTVSNPEVGRARLAAIDAQMEQAGAYVSVRERILAREEANAASRAAASDAPARPRRR